MSPGGARTGAIKKFQIALTLVPYEQDSPEVVSMLLPSFILNYMKRELGNLPSSIYI